LQENVNIQINIRGYQKGRYFPIKVSGRQDGQYSAGAGNPGFKGGLEKRSGWVSRGEKATFGTAEGDAEGGTIKI